MFQEWSLDEWCGGVKDASPPIQGTGEYPNGDLMQHEHPPRCVASGIRSDRRHDHRFARPSGTRAQKKNIRLISERGNRVFVTKSDTGTETDERDQEIMLVQVAHDGWNVLLVSVRRLNLMLDHFFVVQKQPSGEMDVLDSRRLEEKNILGVDLTEHVMAGDSLLFCLTASWKTRRLQNSSPGLRRPGTALENASAQGETKRPWTVSRSSHSDEPIKTGAVRVGARNGGEMRSLVFFSVPRGGLFFRF